MEQDTFKTDVIFRRWTSPSTINKCIFALFPYVINDIEGNIMSYEHIGQHGGANYYHCMKRSVPATEEEYKDAYDELTNYCGYNLRIVKRRNYNKYLSAYKEAKSIQ